MDLEQEQPIESIYLSKGTFPEKYRIISDQQTGLIVDSFEFKTASGLQFTVLSVDKETDQDLYEAFKQASQMPAIKPTTKQKISKGIVQAAKLPWNITQGFVFSLEKIGDGFEATPDFVFRNKKSTKQRVTPSNVVSGLGFGTKSMLTNVFQAVTGIITEPVKGAKQGGIKGGAVGFGKGILGLVCKPVKGTLDLVTQTTRGITNTPRTVYVGMSRITKRVPKNQSNNPNEPDVDDLAKKVDLEDDVLIGEADGEHIYISKSALKESIENSQVLSALLYESERQLGKEDQQKMNQIIQRQRQLLYKKEWEIMKQESKKDKIKTITEDLLKSINENFAQGAPLKDIAVDRTPSHEGSSNEEKEISLKLQQILNILEEKNKPQIDEELKGEEEMKEDTLAQAQMFVKEVFDDASTEELQVYWINAKELDQFDENEEEEFKSFLEEARKSALQEIQETEEISYEVQQFLETKNKMIEKASKFNGFSYSDDFRAADAGYYGGFALTDNDLTHRLRSSGKEILKEVGKKILSGKFNLTTISFPIRCMCPKSMLVCQATICGVAPFYLTAAALTTDPVERMKLVMAGQLAYIYPTHIFEKPLNPILGETYQAYLDDGTKVYMEQTQHRPPVTSLIFEGPDGLWTLTGWASWGAKAWINSAALVVDGRKQITFKDGTVIKFNNSSDQFNNIFIGTIGHQITGKIEYFDTQHNIYGTYEIGSVKKKTQDYLEGQIQHNGKKVADIYGNYMGYLDINKKRYLDVRETKQYYYELKKESPFKEFQLPSDATFRIDATTLMTGDVKLAQIKKVELEELQRHDRKLREICNTRREKYNRKFHFSR